MQPLEQAIAAKKLAKQNLHPDPGTAQRQRLRQLPRYPVDLTPGQLRGDAPGVEHAKGALRKAEEAWNAIRDAASDASSDLGALAKQSASVADRATRSLASASKTLEGQIAHYEDEIGNAVSMRIDPALATEIRAGLKGLPETKVAKHIDDPRVASALLTAPAFLTGRTKEELSRLRDQAEQTHAPEAYRKRAESQRALDNVTSAVSRFQSTIDARINEWRRAAAQPGTMVRLGEIADAG